MTENIFHMKYSERLAALHLTVSVALRRVGSARSLVTSFISDSIYLYRYHSLNEEKCQLYIFHLKLIHKTLSMLSGMYEFKL